MPTETREMNREAADSCGPLGNINAPKYGTIIPNRIFVGGISTSTTETDLNQLFAAYGHVINTKIIKDRAGVSKGYGFITFSNNEEAIRLQKDADNITLKERRLNIAPAIVKQPFRSWNDSQPSQPVGQSAMAYQPLYRTSLNYNAVYVQQPTGPPQGMPQIENQVYQNPVYPGVPQSPGQQYQYAYPPQQFFYHPYPYSVVPYDNMQHSYQYGENLNGIGEAQMYAPPYYMQHHPQDMYYSQQPLQPLVIPPESYQPVIFQGARSVDSSDNSPEQKAVEYTTLTVNKPEEEIVKPKIADSDIPIVSLNNSLRVERNGNRQRGNYPRRNIPPRHLAINNNNNTEFANRNFSRGKGRRPPFSPRAPFNQPQRPITSNNQAPPQYPCYIRPQYYHTNPSMYSQPSVQKRSFYNKGKYPQKGKKNWNNQINDQDNTGALTPPITPKSAQESNHMGNTDELTKTLEGMKI